VFQSGQDSFVLLRVANIEAFIFFNIVFSFSLVCQRCVKTKVFSQSKRPSQHTRKANAEDLREQSEF